MSGEPTPAATATEAAATATPAATDAPATQVTSTILSDAAKAAATETKATDAKATGAETKADTGAKAGEEARAADSKDGKAADPNAPIEYGDFALPEGVTLDTETMTEAQALFQETKLPKENAQKYVDLYTKQIQKFADGLGENWVRTNQQWVKDFKADPEIGGAREQATIALTQAAMTRFGTPKLQEALVLTGAGNHPEFIRFFARVAAATGEGTHVQAGQGAASARPAEHVLYPSMAPKE